jgi:RNA polymerase sigma factor (sigma-70 family)
MTDADLMRLARRDPSAFRAIYDRHVRSIFGWLVKQVGEQTAWELTAETFAQAWISRKRYKPVDEAGSAGPWLHGIARNLHRHWARNLRVESSATRRLQLELEQVLDGSEIENIDRIFASSLGPDLTASLSRLPADQRLAIELRVIHELPYEAIAIRLDCTQDVVRMRVMRGLRTLKKEMRGQLT